jgi:hypothetical protein
MAWRRGGCQALRGTHPRYRKHGFLPNHLYEGSGVGGGGTAGHSI